MTPLHQDLAALDLPENPNAHTLLLTKICIQCDEQRPTCSGCLRNGHECLYDPVQVLTIRDQTAAAEANARKKWRARASKADEPSNKGAAKPQAVHLSSQGNEGCPPSLSLIALHQDQATRGGSVPAALVPSREHLAVVRFLRDYCPTYQGLPNESITFIPSLYRLYGKAGEASPLQLAMTAAAQANFAHQHGLPEMKVEATRNYGQALAWLRSVTSVSTVTQVDELLLINRLLSIFEVCHFLLPLLELDAHRPFLLERYPS